MEKNNLRNLINNEEHEIWTKLAEEILDIDSGVVVFLDVEKDIEAKEGIVSIGFASYPRNDTEIILHGASSYGVFVDYKDEFLDSLDVEEEDIEEVFDEIPHEVFVKFVANQIYTYVYNMIS